MAAALVGQKLAAANHQFATAMMSACIIAAQLVMLPIAVVPGRKADQWGRKPILLAGFGILPIRALPYILSNNTSWLITVQLLDGVGAGIFGVLTPMVVADLMRGAGRYNVALGFVATVQGIGASLSGLAAGVLVDHLGYNAAFASAAVVAASAFLLSCQWQCRKRPARRHGRRHQLRSACRHDNAERLKPGDLLDDVDLVEQFPQVPESCSNRFGSGPADCPASPTIENKGRAEGTSMAKRVSRLSVREGYDLWAESYDRTANPLVALDRRHTIAHLRPRQGERILDAGCGTGANLRRIVRKGSRPVGVDFSRGMLRVAQRNARGAGLAQADLHRELPLQRGRFDAVLCALVSEHLQQLSTLFTEAFAILRRGGRLVFSAFHPELARAGVEANFEHGDTEYRLGAERYTVADYLGQIDDAGFDRIRWREYVVDAPMVERIPPAAKYLGRPLLLVIDATRR